MGAPKDGFGGSFPGDYSKMGKPVFDDAKFKFDEKMAAKDLVMKVKYISMFSYI